MQQHFKLLQAYSTVSRLSSALLHAPISNPLLMILMSSARQSDVTSTLYLIEGELELCLLLRAGQHQVPARVVHAQVVEVEASVEHLLQVAHPDAQEQHLYAIDLVVNFYVKFSKCACIFSS